MDFNITSRVDFEEQYIEKFHKAYPSGQTGFALNVNKDQCFLLKKIKWQPAIRKTPTQPPLLVMINEKISDAGEISFFPPIKLLMTDQIKVIAPMGTTRSNADPNPHIPMNFRITGTLFTLKPGAIISDKELAGISLLDHNNRGSTLLEEEALNSLSDYLVSVGGPNLRALPISLAAINLLPEVMQAAICNFIFSPKSLQLALPKENEKALPSDIKNEFVNDACKIAIPSGTNLDYIEKLANHMLSQGWKKS